MKRKYSFAASAALVVAGLALVVTAFKPHHVSVTESDALARLNENFSAERPAAGVASAVVKSFHAKFDEARIRDGAVHLSATVTFVPRAFGKPVSIDAVASGLPRYDEKARGFFLSAASVEITDIRYGAERPTGPPSVGKIEGWMSGALQSAIADALARRPVYRLDGVGGWVLKTSLRELRLEPGRMVAVLSAWRLSLAVITGFLGVVSGTVLLIFLASRPGASKAVNALGVVAEAASVVVK